mgnify:CR=1 FL=1
MAFNMGQYLAMLSGDSADAVSGFYGSSSPYTVERDANGVPQYGDGGGYNAYSGINPYRYSYMDREEIIKKIGFIKDSVNSKDLPNVYLLHGEFNDSEINELYNHPKVKAMVSLTKGEGFGRPLLEAAVTGKPVITTNWSGHTDFLNKELEGESLMLMIRDSLRVGLLTDHVAVKNVSQIITKELVERKIKTIKDTLNSVLSQSYKNIEHIIVDGGSNDQTMKILKRY